MNLNDYASAKQEVQEWFLRQKGKKLTECVSIISGATHIPCIVCAFWIGQVSGWPEEILNNIETLYKAYSYTNILGIPESWPGRKK